MEEEEEGTSIKNTWSLTRDTHTRNMNCGKQMNSFGGDGGSGGVIHGENLVHKTT